MTDKSTQLMQSRVLVARRYVEHGFLDAAMRLFAQNPAMVAPQDWTKLAERMIERDRVMDAVRVCEIGGVPPPRKRLLELGDQCLDRKDTDRAIHFFELGNADEARWSRVVDVLTTSPGQELRAIQLAERYLIGGDDSPTRLKLVSSADAPRLAEGADASDADETAIGAGRRRPARRRGSAARAEQLQTLIQ
jgi:hypothetical protein